MKINSNCYTIVIPYALLPVTNGFGNIPGSHFVKAFSALLLHS